jgi:hypothetical protein
MARRGGDRGSGRPTAAGRGPSLVTAGVAAQATGVGMLGTGVPGSAEPGGGARADRTAGHGQPCAPWRSDDSTTSMADVNRVVSGTGPSFDGQLRHLRHRDAYGGLSRSGLPWSGLSWSGGWA